ncbi:Superoxide dismutase [Cu-Zn] [Stylophora pistillata]|uniref:Superoxide dismutase [Cu-Zn] n=1 Tax=Stylophora pistillata TaxID=50429 RepID=A0A2B4SYK8_STYPI|nr:Superoxide dismutase [Cu-Zn] [Stylophora pistillata]
MVDNFDISCVVVWEAGAFSGHHGDLGNITAGPDGVAKIDIRDKLVSVVGVDSVVGRTIVVHAKQDDLGKGGNDESLKTGNAGARLACGVIGLTKSIFLLVMARAVCHLAGDIQGTITFLQEQPGGPCVIKGMLQGLTEGHHGIHILEFGDISQGCKSAGAHFNPHNKTHGGPEDNNSRHVGDLGNIEANDQGQAEVNFTDSVVSLTGEYSVIGRTLEDLKTLEFRHRSLKISEKSLKISADESKLKFSFVFSVEISVCEGVDDLGIGGHELSLTTGNSGACLACGIIGISKYSEQTKVPPDDPV